MEHISETWICNFLKMNFSHSTKVVGMFIWAKTDGGKKSFTINWDDFSEATFMSKKCLRFGLEMLEQAGIIKIDHEHKMSTVTISLVK